MNHFKQRIPGYIDSRDITVVEFDFNTTEELESHPHIQNWLSRYPSAILAKWGNVLGFLGIDDFKFLAIGWIKNPDEVNIPEPTEKEPV